MSKLFEEERQVSIDNLDLTYSPDGLTISGHLKAAPGKDGAEMLHSLIAKLNDAVKDLEGMDPVEIVEPQKVDPLFGKAFD